MALEVPAEASRFRDERTVNSVVFKKDSRKREHSSRRHIKRPCRRPVMKGIGSLVATAALVVLCGSAHAYRSHSYAYQGLSSGAYVSPLYASPYPSSAYALRCGWWSVCPQPIVAQPLPIFAPPPPAPVVQACPYCEPPPRRIVKVKKWRPKKRPPCPCTAEK